MIRNLVKIAFALLLSFNVSAQNFKTGTSIISAGINFCSYNSTATDLSTLSKYSSSLSGINLSGSYNYAVLNKVSLRAEAGYSLYTSLATAYQAGVGAEYHFHLSHVTDPFDLFIAVNGGYTHLNYKEGLLAVSGSFKSPGIYYGLGFGIRKYLGNVGIFADANYDIHNYNGGEVIVSDNVKIPYTLKFSGFNFGGGICWKFVPAHQNVY
jgi:hypothetical protein